VLAASAISGSVQGLLEDDKCKFHRMPSVDAFNQVFIYVY